MKAPAVAFGGDLSLIPLFDLGQLLRLNRATGCLTIQSGDRKGALYFDKGDLVNAVDDLLNEGEIAAFGLFGWRSGTFEFQAEARAGARMIESGTEAVMMEAARRLDETGVGPDDEPDTSQTRRLKDRQVAMEALRDVFRRIAGEARQTLWGVDALATTIQLYELSHPEDRLIYRTGHPPRMRTQGRWARVPQPPLGREDFEELRARLLDTCDPVVNHETAQAPGRRLTLADGRALALDLLRDAEGESIWLRPLGARLPEPAALAGDLAGLTTLLGLPEALLLLGASDLSTARRLLEAAACLATGPADTLVMVSRDGACRPAPEYGHVLHVTPEGLGATLDAIEPEIVALDPGLRSRDLSLDNLASVPRVFAGIVGHNSAAFPARWFYRMAPDEPAPASAWLASMLAGIIAARGTAGDPGTLFVSTWLLEAGEREAALRGDSEGLDPPSSRAA